MKNILIVLLTILAVAGTGIAEENDFYTKYYPLIDHKYSSITSKDDIYVNSISDEKTDVNIYCSFSGGNKSIIKLGVLQVKAKDYSGIPSKDPFFENIKEFAAEKGANYIYISSVLEYPKTKYIAEVSADIYRITYKDTTAPYLSILKAGLKETPISEDVLNRDLLNGHNFNKRMISTIQNIIKENKIADGGLNNIKPMSKRKYIYDLMISDLNNIIDLYPDEYKEYCALYKEVNKNVFKPEELYTAKRLYDGLKGYNFMMSLDLSKEEKEYIDGEEKFDNTNFYTLCDIFIKALKKGEIDRASFEDAFGKDSFDDMKRFCQDVKEAKKMGYDSKKAQEYCDKKEKEYKNKIQKEKNKAKDVLNKANINNKNNVVKDKIVYVTDNSNIYHRTDCVFLKDNRRAIFLKDAIKDYKPCSVCKPPKD